MPQSEILTAPAIEPQPIETDIELHPIRYLPLAGVPCPASDEEDFICMKVDCNEANQCQAS